MLAGPCPVWRLRRGRAEFPTARKERLRRAALLEAAPPACDPDHRRVLSHERQKG